MSQGLYNFLTESGDYTKSYEDFQYQFANRNSQKGLYDFMREKGDYTKSLSDFHIQFFSERETQELDDISLGPYELPQVDVTDSKEDDTWVERTLGKNFATDWIGDIWRAGEQGWAQGETVDEAFDVYKKGKNISNEELRRYVEVSNALDKTGASDEMREYEEIKNEAGGGVWGFMKGMIQTRGQVIPQVIISSAAAMASTFFDSEEAAALTIGGAGAGWGTGALAGAGAASIG